MKLITRGLGAGGGVFLVSRGMGGFVLGAPYLLAAVASDGHHLHISFSEPVDTAAALDVSNYYLSGDLRVLAVTMETETSFVLTTSRQSPGVTYEVTVINVEDLSGVPV